MSRLIFVPQFPQPMRYAHWWMSEFPKQLSKYFDEIIVLGKDIITDKLTRDMYENIENFSPIKKAIEYECDQINEYMNIDIKDNDILFLADLSFPGFFSNVLYHKRPNKIYAYYHAGPLNQYDYFSNVKTGKWLSECGAEELINKIFVGSQYHKDKLNCWNADVVRLPKPPWVRKVDNVERINNFITVSRPTAQKYNPLIENIINTEYGGIVRKLSNTWEDYSYFLSSSKCIVISSQEDTFNYTIMDAIICGCIPIAPNYLCFPEILPREYLYDTHDELRKLCDKILNNTLQPLNQMLCNAECNNFYQTISKIMLGEKNG